MAPHTGGPWRWEYNAEHRSVHLVGGDGRQFDLTVMDFQRWGMTGAVPSFRDLSVGGMNLMDRLCDRADWRAPFSGREHHVEWCAAITHGDAVLIAEAPAMALVLALVAAGKARIKTSCEGRLVEFCFCSMAYPFNGSWSRVLAVVGWGKARAGLAAAEVVS